MATAALKNLKQYILGIKMYNDIGIMKILTFVYVRCFIRIPNTYINVTKYNVMKCNYKLMLNN